jgi:hypothetical protein
MGQPLRKQHYIAGAITLAAVVLVIMEGLILFNLQGMVPLAAVLLLSFAASGALTAYILADEIGLKALLLLLGLVMFCCLTLVWVLYLVGQAFLKYTPIWN